MPRTTGFPWRLVTVDIDGTLTLGHGWREIAVAFGRASAFDDAQRRFAAGLAGEDAHLAALLDLATGRTVREVEEVLGRTPKLSGIAEGIGQLRAEGSVVALLSHNPLYVVDWYRRTFGFDDREGVASQPVTADLIGPPAVVHADKAAGLRALLARHRCAARDAVHIGDGPSDAAIFPRVGGGVALNSHSAEVNTAADLALSTEDFRLVVQRLREIVPRPVPDLPPAPSE
jgi:phosphoserine phosphatase